MPSSRRSDSCDRLRNPRGKRHIAGSEILTSRRFDNTLDKILLDATGDEVVVTPNPDDDDAETTLVLSPDNMQKLIAGELNPMVAKRNFNPLMATLASSRL